MARRDKHDLIVIGASMGGVEALMALVEQLPEDLPAAVCIVLHISPGHRSVLPAILSRAGPLTAVHPEDGARLEKGHIYVAPNDQHLLVEEGMLRVVKGPRENNHRPAVDPLFRSAALAYGPRVVGVVLTGAMDCGSAGLLAIKQQGGLAVVQEPSDAYCPDMPQNVLNQMDVDHCVPIAKMGALLNRLSRSPAPLGRKRRASQAIKREVGKLRGDPAMANTPPAGGRPSHFSCPDCGGVLFEQDEQGQLRFNCRVGHAFTGNALVSGQEDALDGALWAAVRSLEENGALARRMASHARERNHAHSAKRYDERAREAEQQALLIRQVAMKGPLPPRDDALSVEEIQ
ncbi:chemotaxis protein CheB [Stigmatella erecta]|uniref:protein-glutamate methylesterase n=1 Tax=Stigmatella erecta TaxID=83460 RepID=A0A1I0L5X2_9BACT|nr:chemotaxis protein CheB [Stigmatella erecta]SEU34093.1 two-component system, chemotaxis family, response regulator CheB [Stigmatella erecta]